jgi:acyl-CoA dehydrogenase
MLTLLAWLVFIGIIGALAFYRSKPLVWIPVAGVVLALYSVTHAISWVALTVFGVIWAALTLVMILSDLRLKLISRPFLTWFCTQQPPLTSAEKIAMAAGGVWYEKEFFTGNPDWKKLHDIPKATLTHEEQAFLDNQVDTLCDMISDWETVQENQDMSADVWDYVKKEKFLGLVISKKYDGRGFSAVAHSAVVNKIATRSVSAAVSIMVPNSLGPAEFLSHYGTDEQKDYYLPRLARGEEIPCFGLTAPNAGSDATNLTDSGVVCKQVVDGKEVLGIRLNFNKRYITLAPVATLLGIAFQLYDPDHLIGEKEYIGITLALVPHTTEGIESPTRHAPLNLAFMNGPIRGSDVFIAMERVIGGQPNVGMGWQMMMECLAVGRGISLPSLGTGAAKFCARMTGAYARVREQFKRPIGEFEGVALSLARIGGLAYLCESTRMISALAVDADTRPSVASAIAKYHLTELGRQAVDDAMDIHGGRGIQMGPRNYLGFLYQSIPVCITVEGANILTRNLIIYGQGVMRCHPFLQDEIRASEHADQLESQKTFDRLLFSHVGFGVNLLVRAITYGVTGGRFIKVDANADVAKYYRQLTRMSNAFALMSEVALSVLGNKLKFKESLSARLGDILSHLYMGAAVLKHYRDHNSNTAELPFVRWSMDYCLSQIQVAMDDFVENFPVRWLARAVRFIVMPYGRAYKYPNDKTSLEVAAALQTNSTLRDHVTRDIYVGHDASDPSGRMEMAFQRLCATQPLLDKLSAAVAERKIGRKLTLDQRIHAAFDCKIITVSEKEELLALDALVWDALQVDDFDMNLKTQGVKKNDKQQQEKS